MLFQPLSNYVAIFRIKSQFTLVQLLFIHQIHLLFFFRIREHLNFILLYFVFNMVIL